MSTACRLITLVNALACVALVAAYAALGHAAAVDLLFADQLAVAEALRSDAAALLTCLSVFTLLPMLAIALGTVALRFEQPSALLVNVVTASCEGLLFTAVAASWHLQAPALVAVAGGLALLIATPLRAGRRLSAAVEAETPSHHHPLLVVCWLLATLAILAAVVVLTVQFSVAPLVAVGEVLVLPDVFAVLDADMASNAAVACAALLFLAAAFLPVVASVWPACVRADSSSSQRDALALAVAFEGGSLVAFCVQHEALRQQLVLRDACAGLVGAHAATLAAVGARWWWATTTAEQQQRHQPQQQR